MVPPRFCTKCGAPLNPGARFCGNCGAAIQPLPVPGPLNPPNQAQRPPQPRAPVPVQPQPAVPPPPPPAPGERIMGVLPGLGRSKGFMGVAQDGFTLVITNQRLIFAAYTTRVANAAFQAAREAAKAQGKGFIGQWGSQLSATGMNHYYQMTPEAILAEETGSFFIPHNQVRGIHFRQEHDVQSARYFYYVEFQTLAGKYNFRSNTVDVRGMKKVLEPVYGKLH